MNSSTNAAAPGSLAGFALEFGLDSFGDVSLDSSGAPQSHAQVLRQLVEQAVLADQLGVDFFGVGEHHRADFAVSAPEVVLAAIAGRTAQMRLGSAVTVLSSDDPVRVFQRFATLDAVAGGRAEVILGRGSFTESFPLFGRDLADYELLFEEGIELFARLRTEQPVTWSGTSRAPLHEQRVFPHTEGGALRTWVGVGGSPRSAIRAARYGFPVLFAIIGGSPEQFLPMARTYAEALPRLGQQPQPIGVHSPGFVADTDEQALEQLWPHYRAMMDAIGRDRGWPALSYDYFLSEASPAGSLYVGSPESVAQKIARTMTVLGASRFQLKYSHGGLGHEQLMRSIELYGSQVIPRVRELLGNAQNSG